MDILYIVMPAYNEAENIEEVIGEWYSVLMGKNERSKLIVADSGSTDETHDILVRLQMKYPKLEILENTDKQHGPKIIALYDFAIKEGADYIFQTDSDGQTNADEFQQFWELRGEYDIIMGKRLVRGDGYMRKLVEIVLCKLLWIYFGVKVPDANAPFRLMKTECVKEYLYKLPIDYNLPNVMLTTYFAYFKENMEFRDITFKARGGGQNSIDFFKIMITGVKALFDFHILKGGIKEK